MTKVDLVAEAFQLDLAFYPGASYAESWLRIDPHMVIPWDDISVGWRMVEKSMLDGSGIRYRLA